MTAPDEPSIAADQRCYRHPDRRAGVSCQRCSRPICPSCMTPASVGFHCPECAASGPRNERLVASAFGRVDPVVTYAIIAVNVVVFLLIQISTDISRHYDLFAGLYRGNLVGGVAAGEWWRIATSGFLHAGLIHVGFNMYALYIMGGAMERVVGWPRFLTVYVVSLFGGSAGALLATDPTIATVGASGAIFGLFGAFVFLQLSRGGNPMQGGIGPIILLNLAITFFVPGISKGGHIGGLLAGLLCGYILFGRTREESRQRSAAARVLVPVCLGIGVVLFAVAVWAADYSTSNLEALI